MQSNYLKDGVMVWQLKQVQVEFRICSNEKKGQLKQKIKIIKIVKLNLN